MFDPELGIIEDEVAVERGAIGYKTADLQARPSLTPVGDADIPPDSEDIGEPDEPEVDEPHVGEPVEPVVPEPKVL